MKKLLQKLRPSASHHQSSSMVISQSNNDDHPTSSPNYHPLLETFVNDPDRFGLRLLPLLPLEPSDASHNFNLDIVAVHGLGGDFFKTWTYTSNNKGENDVFWLSQLLPIDLPGARVYSFGYESRPAFGRSVGSIREFAKQLLQLLLDREKAGKHPPTIFICHSLGGIVVKQAMIIAHEDERFAEVLNTTRAIMFMGTPHRGSDIASSLRPLIAAINIGLKYTGGSAIVGAMRADLIEMLARNSNALDAINESFIHRVKNKQIISCYELEWPENMNQLVVTKQSALLRIPEEEDIPLQANHMSMCRFSSSQDSRYRLVRNALLRAARAVSETAEDLHSPSAQSLHSLTDSERRYISYFQGDSQPALPIERVEGTCTWLLDTPQYREWQEDANSAILWITGDAGCGKTTLMLFMTDLLSTGMSHRNAAGSESVIITFFCAKDVSTRNEGQSIICGLLISLLTSRKHVIRRVKTKYAPIKQEFGQSLEFLWNVLMYALDMVSCDRYYIIIDALDECQAQSRERLLTCIGRTLALKKGEDCLHPKKLKFLFTSQPQTITEWKASNDTSGLHHLKIEDRPSGMTRDILVFIDHKVDQLVQLRRCDTAFANELKMALYDRAQNSFLWVSLVLSYIKSTIILHVNNPRQLLVPLPNNLKEAYLKYLPSSTPQNAGIIKKCVELLVASYRILTLEEIRVFTGIDSKGYQRATEQQLIVFQNSLELMFGPLIRFTDLQVDFVHSTVKDFFLDLGKNAIHSAAQVYGTDIASAHLALAEACVNYLLCEDMDADLFNDIEPSSATTVESIYTTDKDSSNNDNLTDIFNIQDVTFFKDERDVDDEACLRITNMYTSFDYAATNWAHHFASCQHIAPVTLTRKVKLLSRPGNVQVSNWYKYVAHQSRTILPSFDDLDEFLIPAMYDHHKALQSLLSLYNDQSDIVNARCQRGLFWAASRGHSRNVQAFLEHGTDPNFLQNQQSPLIVAVLAGHQNVCAMLLQSSAVDPNFSNNSRRSPLLHAIASGQHEIVNMLLAHKDILVESSDRFGFSPFLEAASSGCLRCLRCLQSDGRSEFTKTDNDGRNALSYAASTESIASVDLLSKILSSEQMQSSDNSGRNAISYAAERSILPVVKRLWKLQISVSQVDKHGRNAISWAVSRPSLVAQKDEENTVLKFLVRNCPQGVDVKDKFGWTPLAWALDRPGDIRSMKILVETAKVDVNRQDETSGRPVLSWAASEGLGDIVGYLLQVPGIKKNLQDFGGRTPVSYAAGSGSLAVLELFIRSQGVDLDIPDYQGRSPLDWARISNFQENIRLLTFKS